MTHANFDEYYSNNTNDFTESALITVFGAPGTGKTIAMKKLVNAIANTNKTELTIIEGKGGNEWGIYKNVVDATDNLEEVRDVFKDLAEEVRYQLQSGVKENRLVLVDEVAPLFDKAGMSREDFRLSEEINKHMKYIATRARSTGVRIVLVSQKASLEAIPAHLRANASLRVAFRLQTAMQEEVALESTGDVSPLDISLSQPGLAVVETEPAAREFVQF